MFLEYSFLFLEDLGCLYRTGVATQVALSKSIALPPDVFGMTWEISQPFHHKIVDKLFLFGISPSIRLLSDCEVLVPDTLPPKHRRMMFPNSPSLHSNDPLCVPKLSSSSPASFLYYGAPCYRSHCSACLSVSCDIERCSAWPASILTLLRRSPRGYE